MNPDFSGEKKPLSNEEEEVENGIDAGFEIDEKEEGFSGFKKKSEEEYAEYQEEAQKMIDGYKHLFATFAGDISLQFKVSDKFMIDFETGEVYNDARWFADKGCSMEQVLWAKLHELSHFRDYAEDTVGMMTNFDEMWAKAKPLGHEILARYNGVYPMDRETLGALSEESIPVSKYDPNKKVSQVDLAAYKIYHTFYNVFDDIYVNNIVSRRAPKYMRERKGGEEVTRLYREKLFEGTDYKDLPRHLQFLYTLLREEMVPRESIQVNDEVDEVLRTRIPFGDDVSYTPREIVEKCIKPRRGRDTTPTTRYEILERTLLPVFEQLVRKDLADWKPEKVLPEGDKLQPFKGEYDKFAENSPDQLNDEDVGEWAIEQQLNFEPHTTKQPISPAEERARAAQDLLDQQFCEKFDITPELFREYKEIEEKVAPYRNDLRQLWMKIVYGSSTARERKMVGHFEKGAEMDIDEVIKRPEILIGNFDNAPIMKKMGSQTREIKRPELIRARVVVDDSISMEEGKREEMAKQVLVLVASSLQEFNAYLDYTRASTRSKTHTDTEGWVFGSSTERIKGQRFETGRSFDEEQAEIIRMFGRLSSHPVHRGATLDHLALEAIEESLTEEDTKNIAAGKLLEMLFLVTDGASGMAEKSRQVVDRLLERGGYAYGFQIGQSSIGEKRTFDYVWNKDRPQKLGVHMGEKIENVVPAVAVILKEHMRDVRVSE